MPQFKEMMLKFTGIAAAFFVMAGCDVGFNEDKQDDRTLKEANKIINEYSRVQGLYQGVLNLTVDGKINPVDIEIRLNPKVVYEAGQSGGEPTPQVSLEGTFEVLSFAWPYNSVQYKGRFWYAQDGRIQMSQMGGEVNYGLRFETFPVNDELINGKLWSSDGLLGEFSAALVTRDVRAPGEGSEEEKRRRYEESYKDVLGTYIGRVNNPNDPEKHRRNLPLRFLFYLAGTSLEGTLDNPDSEFDTPRAFTVIEYRPDTGAIQIRGEAQGGGTRLPGYGRFYARGFVKDGVLSFVEVSDHLGPLGTYTGQKQSAD